MLDVHKDATCLFIENLGNFDKDSIFYQSNVADFCLDKLKNDIKTGKHSNIESSLYALLDLLNFKPQQGDNSQKEFQEICKCIYLHSAFLKYYGNLKRKITPLERLNDFVDAIYLPAIIRSLKNELPKCNYAKILLGNCVKVVESIQDIYKSFDKIVRKNFKISKSRLYYKGQFGCDIDFKRQSMLQYCDLILEDKTIISLQSNQIKSIRYKFEYYQILWDIQPFAAEVGKIMNVNNTENPYYSTTFLDRTLTLYSKLLFLNSQTYKELGDQTRKVLTERIDEKMDKFLKHVKGSGLEKLVQNLHQVALVDSYIRTISKSSVLLVQDNAKAPRSL